MGADASVWAGIAKGITAGAAGTLVLDSVSRLIYRLEPREARERYERVSRGKYPGRVAGEKLERGFGLRLDEDRREKLGRAVHWGIGLTAGLGYVLLRRRWPGIDRSQGLLYGLGFFVLGDEIVNTVLGLAGPPTAYPWQAHLRGLATHVAFGMTVATTLDLLDRVG